MKWHNPQMLQVEQSSTWLLPHPHHSYVTDLFRLTLFNMGPHSLNQLLLPSFLSPFSTHPLPCTLHISHSLVHHQPCTEASSITPAFSTVSALLWKEDSDSTLLCAVHFFKKNKKKQTLYNKRSKWRKVDPHPRINSATVMLECYENHPALSS